MATTYILGAGASAACPNTTPLPLQRGFFRTVYASSPLTRQIFHLPEAQLLKEWLAASPFRGEESPWSRLQTDKDIHLEALYGAIENDASLPLAAKTQFLKALDHLIWQALSVPVIQGRTSNGTCPLHQVIAERLVPGDTVVNFNYDFLMDDAMLFHCREWYPLTGYGFLFDEVHADAVPGKDAPVSTLVPLFKPHGSISFRISWSRPSMQNPGWPWIGYLRELDGIASEHQFGPMNAAMPQPLVVPPSNAGKALFWSYIERMLAKVGEALAQSDRLVVIGYSLPDGDQHVKKVLSRFRGETIVVDHATDEPAFVSRYAALGLRIVRTFPSFQTYVAALGAPERRSAVSTVVPKIPARDLS